MPSVVAKYGKAIGAKIAGRSPAEILGEKVYSATLHGLSFLPYLDTTTEETQAIRDTYPTMLKSPVVKAALHGKVCAVSSLDLQSQPPDESPRAQEVADFTRYAYTQAIDGGFPKLAESILIPMLIFGTNVVEKVWMKDLWPRGKWAGRRFYRDMKAKDLSGLIIVEDEFRNVIGLKSTRYGQNEVFDPRDFVIARNMSLFEGPGQSDLRAAYAAYWKLDTVEKLRVIHLEKFTSPFLQGTYNDSTDLPKLEAALAAAKSRTWITIPEGVKVDCLSLATRGEAEFAQAIRDFKEDIALAISGAFLQMLTSNAGGGGDIRGGSGTQQTTSELFVWRLAAELCAIIDRQITPDLVDMNYAGADYPTTSLGGVNYGELQRSIVVDEAAQRMGFKLSRKAFAKKYALQQADSPEDEMAPAPAQPPPGAGGGMGFGFTEVDDQGRRFFAEGPRTGADDADTTGPAAEQVAGPHDSDHDAAEALLENAKWAGAATLATITQAAVLRLLESDDPLGAETLFDEGELAQLAAQIAATNATAELLGRARIREREQAIAGVTSEQEYAEFCQVGMNAGKPGPCPTAVDVDVGSVRVVDADQDLATIPDAAKQKLGEFDAQFHAAKQKRSAVAQQVQTLDHAVENWSTGIDPDLSKDEQQAAFTQSMQEAGAYLPPKAVERINALGAKYFASSMSPAAAEHFSDAIYSTHTAAAEATLERLSDTTVPEPTYPREVERAINKAPAAGKPALVAAVNKRLETMGSEQRMFIHEDGRYYVDNPAHVALARELVSKPRSG